ncbi:MAG: hypothetical protein AAF372_02545 [Pseudomonadota bacterium]
MSIKRNLSISLLIVGGLMMHTAIAKTSTVEQPAKSEAACEVLADAHSALKILRIDSNEALNRIDMALESIDRLDDMYADYSGVKQTDTNNHSSEYVYHHYYPELSGPTKPCSHYVYNILKRYDANYSEEGNKFFLDYPLAKAELETAKLAIESGDLLEARYSLLRSMQAVYVNPTFNIYSQVNQ